MTVYAYCKFQNRFVRKPECQMPSPKQILTQNNHSRSFKVIYFSVNKEPLEIIKYNKIIVALNAKVRKIWPINNYLLQYNICGLVCESSGDIVSESSKQIIAIFDDPTLI